jgi:[ribosomal protein S5]-alanine N-acetyltransferase
MMDILFKEWSIKDAEKLALIGDNRNIFNNMSDGFPSPYTIEKAEKYIINVLKDRNACTKAILSDDIIVGNISVVFMDDIYRENGRLAYFLDENYWGKGIMTSAISLFCEHIFSMYADIQRIFADPFESNVGSRKVLEKCGFKLEGILRKNVIKNGIRQNSYLYSLIRDEHIESFDTV